MRPFEVLRILRFLFASANDCIEPMNVPGHPITPNRPVMAVAPSVLTSLCDLESYLWEAANILRGPVDAADF